VRLRARRGLLDAGLVGTVALLVAGVLLGSGFAQTEMSMPDPLTWLWNTRGELTRVNPETGSPTDRLPGVALPGDPMTLVQNGDTLVVTNLRTFEVTTIDVPMLRFAGTRRGSGAVRVLLTQGEVYLANLAAGTVERIDPLSAATVGAPWQAGAALIDAAADEQGGVFALDQAGQLTGLRWSPGRTTLVPDLPHQVSGVDADAALVPHATGVTVFTSSGVVEQVGTGADRAVQVGELTPPLVVASVSPADLVPVSTPQTSEVHLLRNGSAVTVDAGGLNCGEPGRTAVFEGRVYVPCLGDGRVLVLDQEGRQAAPDLVTVPGGRPEVLVNAGLLFVNEPDDSRGLVVRKDGSVKAIDTHGSTVPVLDQAGRPTALPTPTQGPPRPPVPTGPGGNPRSPSPTPTPTTATATPTTATATPTTATPTTVLCPPGAPGTTCGPPTTPPPSTSTPIDPARYTPTNAQAVASGDRSVTVSWVAAAVQPTAPNGYRILRAGTTEVVSTAAAGATSAIVPNLPAGLRIAFVVEAIHPGVGSGSFASQATPEVQVFGPAGAPTVAVQILGRGPATLDVLVTVTPVDDGGDPGGIRSYDVTVTSGNTGATMASQTGVSPGTQYRATVPCGGMGDVCLSGGTVNAAATLNNAAGGGPAGSGQATVDPLPRWQYGESVLLVTVDGQCLNASFTVQTCSNTNAGQWWRIGGTGYVANAGVPGQCLRHGSAISFTSEECGLSGGGTSSSRRWRRVNLAQNGDGNPIGNTGFLQGDESPNRCVFQNGFSVSLRSPCQFNDQERLTLFPLLRTGPWPA
jgi:hypothetical protein